MPLVPTTTAPPLSSPFTGFSTIELSKDYEGLENYQSLTQSPPIIFAFVSQPTYPNTGIPSSGDSRVLFSFKKNLFNLLHIRLTQSNFNELNIASIDGGFNASYEELMMCVGEVGVSPLNFPNYLQYQQDEFSLINQHLFTNIDADIVGTLPYSHLNMDLIIQEQSSDNTMFDVIVQTYNSTRLKGHVILI